MPASLAEIAADFLDLAPKDRLQLLLEFSQGLPDLPERYADAPESLEQVHECQSPLFLTVEVGEGMPRGAQPVSLFFSAPPEAPTTRGFAGILRPWPERPQLRLSGVKTAIGMTRSVLAA